MKIIETVKSQERREYEALGLEKDIEAKSYEVEEKSYHGTWLS